MQEQTFTLKKSGIVLDENQAQLQRYKMGKLLIFACFFMYTISMAAKGVFAAETKFLIDLWDLTQAEAQMANTYYFVLYGIVQIFMFIFMSKINIRKYIICTVPVAALFSALMGFVTGIEGMWIFFGLNGIFQAGIYCGCNYTLTRFLPEKLMPTANKFMNIGYATGTVIAYFMSAIFIGLSLWRPPYVVIGILFLVSVIIFAIVTNRANEYEQINLVLDRKERQSINVQSSDTNHIVNDYPLFTVENNRRRAVFYVIVLVMTFLMTSLYYSVMNFMTSMLVEVHNMPQDISIYVSILAPITISIGPIIAINRCEKHKDYIKEAIVFALVLLPLPLLLALFFRVNVLLFIVMTVLFLIISNGLKSTALSVLAFKLKGIINVASFSAISNAIASFSAGIAPAVIGSIKDNFGWTATYWTAFIITSVVLVLLIVIDLWVRAMYKKKNHVALKDN